MERSDINLLALFLVLAVGYLPVNALAEGNDNHHLPHNHIALIVGTAMERDDGHEENGGLLGLEYEAESALFD